MKTLIVTRVYCSVSEPYASVSCGEGRRCGGYSFFELSRATGSGLPICCISGLAVVEAGMGSGCGALEEATVSKLFWEQLLDFFFFFTKWLCGRARQSWGRTDGRLENVSVYGRNSLNGMYSSQPLKC